MIKAVFSGLAGAWNARNVQRGEIPERYAVPLAFLATRIPTPLILAGAIGYGIYRWDQEFRSHAARDVTPLSGERPPPKKKPSSRRKQPKPAASDRKPDTAQ